MGWGECEPLPVPMDQVDFYSILLVPSPSPDPVLLLVTHKLEKATQFTSQSFLMHPSPLALPALSPLPKGHFEASPRGMPICRARLP